MPFEVIDEELEARLKEITNILGESEGGVISKEYDDGITKALSNYGLLIISKSFIDGSLEIEMTYAGQSYFRKKQEKMIGAPNAIDNGFSVNIGAGTTNVMIQQNTKNSKQEINYNVQESDMVELLEKILANKNNQVFVSDFGDSATEIFSIAEEAINSSGESRTSKLKEALCSIRSIVENASGSLMATGICAAISAIIS